MIRKSKIHGEGAGQMLSAGLQMLGERKLFSTFVGRIVYFVLTLQFTHLR